MRQTRIGIVSNNSAEQEDIMRYITQYCDVYGVIPEYAPFSDEETLFRSLTLRRCDVVVVALDGADGFLLTRKLREADKNVRLIMVGDAQQYAVMGMRLHISDFIMRPVTFKSLVRAMQLAGVTDDAP